MEEDLLEETWDLCGQLLKSRLLVGTARYPDMKTLSKAIETSGAEVVTVSMRYHKPNESNIFYHLSNKNLKILPNTAGCYTAQDAILTAKLAREALHTNWVKLEVIGDDETLLPNPIELISAAEILVREGFHVLAYCSDDVVICRKLENLGCSAIMPLASPIGTGRGIQNKHNIALIRHFVKIPVIIDAGIGTASDVVEAMELGVDAVLLNSAIAGANHPIQMAKAMKLASESGRYAYLAGRIPKKFLACPSTPVEGCLESINCVEEPTHA